MDEVPSSMCLEKLFLGIVFKNLIFAFRSTKNFMKKYNLDLTAATFIILDSNEASMEVGEICCTIFLDFYFCFVRLLVNGKSVLGIPSTLLVLYNVDRGSSSGSAEPLIIKMCNTVLCRNNHYYYMLRASFHYYKVPRTSR